MSKHEVKVIRLGEILPHPNGDMLEITNVWGYQCIIRKGAHKTGDLMAYIEPDYSLPLDRNEFKFLDDGKGKSRLRVTMRRFRGEPSYGLLIPAPQGSSEGDNVMEILGIERWEPPPPKGEGLMRGIQVSGPDIPAPVYDLENWKKHTWAIPEGEEVLYLEKLHGTSSRFVFHNGEMYCGSRTTWKMKPGQHVKNIEWVDVQTGEQNNKEIVAPPNTWWACLEQNPWIEDWCRNHPNMVLYGEIYGPSVQGADFAYGKSAGQYGFAAFDILHNGRWVDNVELFDNPIYCTGLNETVRLLHRGQHNSEYLINLAEKPSVYPKQKIREGIVLKPVKERNEPKLGRVALKHVSDAYLMHH